MFVDAQNPDIADMVVATGIHASRNIQTQAAEIVEEVQVIEALLDCTGDWE